MAITNGYVTLRELKDHMGKKSSIISNDVLYENSIESASREIDWYITGRRDYVVFSAKTLSSSKVMAGMGLNSDCLAMNGSQSRIYFPDKINTITSVVDNGVTLTVNVDYVVGYDFIERLGKFTSDLENGVVISGTISSDTIPDETKKICLNMAEVLTGMSTKVVTDSDGVETEIRLKNYPSWVTKKLRSIGMQNWLL